MIRTYKFRLYPSGKQQDKLFKNFKICKEVYNLLLAESKVLRITGKFDLNSLVKDVKITCEPYYSQVHSQVLQNVSDRVSKSFTNFFRKCKDKKVKKKGFPRFKSKVKSVTYPQSGFKFKSDKVLYLSKIGNIPLVLHQIPKGKVKTLTVKVNPANQWFAYLSCEIEQEKKVHHSNEEVGIDVGLEYFATLSNGELVENPRYLVKSLEKLRKEQRKLSRKKKKSNNRKKQRLLVARQHNNVTNKRNDFLHKLSFKLVNSYSFIAVENLQINNMLKNRYLAKSISDASWNSFIQMLSYKAVKCGGQIVKVNPRNTSKKCSHCGMITDMPLSQREFNCPNCNLKLYRDLNSAINILLDGRAGQARTYTPVDKATSTFSTFF